MKKFLRVFFILTVISLISVNMAISKPFRVSKLPDKGRTYGCATCHFNPMGGGKRNPFGQDYEKIAIPAGDSYTEKLGTLDSDGDGAANDQEFASGTHPGDPKSKP